MWCLCNDHCQDIVMIIWSSINCPTVIFLPTVCYFSREKPLVKPTAPGSSFSYICFVIYFSLAFYSDLLNQKIQKYLAAIHFYLFCLAFDLSIYYKFLTSVLPILRRRTPKGIDNPLTRRVARCCYLCWWLVYVVLLGSPTGSITLVSYLREIPTVVVLHHPFLFGQIPT